MSSETLRLGSGLPQRLRDPLGALRAAPLRLPENDASKAAPAGDDPRSRLFDADDGEARKDALPRHAGRDEIGEGGDAVQERHDRGAAPGEQPDGAGDLGERVALDRDDGGVDGRELAGIVRRERRDAPRLRGLAHLETAEADRVEVLAAGQEPDLVPGPRETAAEVASDSSRPDDREPHRRVPRRQISRAGRSSDVRDSARPITRSPSASHRRGSRALDHVAALGTRVELRESAAEALVRAGPAFPVDLLGVEVHLAAAARTDEPPGGRDRGSLVVSHSATRAGCARDRAAASSPSRRAPSGTCRCVSGTPDRAALPTRRRPSARSRS